MRQEMTEFLDEHPACKNWVTRCWCGYLSGSTCRLFPYGPADATGSKTTSSLALFKSRPFLSFGYRLTQIVLQKRPLSWCSCSSRSRRGRGRRRRRGSSQHALFEVLHRESKKQDTQLVSIISPNNDRFSKFFHC